MPKHSTKWYQEGDRLFFEYSDIVIYFDMPSGWKLSETHPTTIKLAEFVIIGPLLKDGYRMSDVEKWEKRQSGKRAGLALSTGVDSTAAMLLMPEDTILYYNRRSNGLCSLLNQSNALNMIKKMDRHVYTIESNHEGIRVRFGQRVGFTTDYACLVGLILMADYLDLGTVATGTILGSTFVYKGARYIEYLGCEKQLRWDKIFKQAGLDLIMPVGGCSEVITNEIVQNSRFRDLAYSCIRGTVGESCNECFKCYRKNLLNGIVTDRSQEVEMNLSKSPIHQGDSLIYALQKNNISLPQTEQYDNLDLAWMEGYYPEALRLVTKDFRDGIKNKLKQFGIKPMTKEDIKKMKAYSIDESYTSGPEEL